MPVDLTTEEIELSLVLDAIEAKYGYRLSEYSSSSMRRRIRAAMSKYGAGHLGELQHRLLTDRSLFTSIFDDLTVHVSDLFRDPGFYAALRRHLVPLLRTYPELKIWHAGCASGEEVYSMAILLAEENLYERAQLYATDVSGRSLDQARKGLYTEERFAQFEANYEAAGGKGKLADYFCRAYGRVSVLPWLQKNVVFFQHDLAVDQALGRMNVILCRNVLIYFQKPLRNRVLDVFATGLCEGGFLCLGQSESLVHHAAFSDFEVNDRIYRYGGGS
jgi:chemotaxis protein methyltransferase CheR